MPRAPSRSLLARLLGWPLRRALDRRTQWAAQTVGDRLHDDLEPMGDTLGAISERLDAHHNHMRAVEDRVDANERRLLGALGALGARLGDGGQPSELAHLDAATAALLNWADGPRGFAAQGGLWLNPPVAIEHHPGAVAPLLVNERIVEQPFAFARLAPLPPGSRILDVGGAESSLGLSLASLGHRVTTVDPRGVPVAHPNLTAARVRVDELPVPDDPFDAALAISAIEHFGLGHYGATEPAPGNRADLEATRTLRALVKPGGLLVLTVPLTAVPSTDDFQRTYDAAGVRELLEGWTIRELAAAWRTDRLTWLPGAIDQPQGDAGVALALAVNDA